MLTRREYMGIMSLSEIMDKSIDLLRKYIKSIVSFALLYGMVWLFGIIIIIVFSAFAAVIFGEVFLIVLIPIVILLALAVFMSSNAGIIKIISQEYFMQKVDAAGALKAAFGNFLRMCGLAIVIAIMAVPLAAIFYVVVKVFDGVFGEAINSIDKYSWGIVVLAALLIISLILAAAIIIGYISIFIFSIHAIVLENKGIFAAIKRSWRMVKHNYWKVFGCVILFYISIYAIQLSMDSFTALIVGLFYMVLRFLNLSQDLIAFFSLFFNRIQIPVSMLSYAVITPIYMIMLCLLYFNIRFQNEGLDMRIKLREIQSKRERMQQSVDVYNGHFRN